MPLPKKISNNTHEQVCVVLIPASAVFAFALETPAQDR